MQKGALIAQGRTAEIYEWGDGSGKGDERILKLFRAGFPTSSAEYEFDIAQQINQASVPAPRAYDLITQGNRTGILYQRVRGHTMLRELTSRPWRTPSLARTLAELHAQIHQRSISGLPSQRAKFEQWLNHAVDLSDRQKEVIMRALRALPDGHTLCHGDFHPDNVILSTDGPILIDWTNAASGNSLGDVGWTSLLLRIGGLPPGSARAWLIQRFRRLFHEAYLRRYEELRPGTREQLKRWALPVAAARLGDGIPEEREALMTMIKQLVQTHISSTNAM